MRKHASVFVILFIVFVVMSAVMISSSGSYTPWTKASSGQRVAIVFNEVLTSTTSASSGSNNFQGLVYDEEDIAEIRAESEQNYRDMPLFSVTPEGLLESFCGRYIPDSATGYAFTQNPDSDAIQIVAHVEGEKQVLTWYNETNATSGTVTPGTRYLYKLSFQVTNSFLENQSLTFNVYVDNTALYNNSIILANGESFGMTGTSKYITQSNNNYNQICLRFSGDLPQYGPLNDLEDLPANFCNSIVTSTSAASTYTAPSYVSAATSSSSSSGSSAGNGQSQSPNAI